MNIYRIPYLSHSQECRNDNYLLLLFLSPSLARIQVLLLLFLYLLASPGKPFCCLILIVHLHYHPSYSKMWGRKWAATRFRMSTINVLLVKKNRNISLWVLVEAFYFTLGVSSIGILPWKTQRCRFCSASEVTTSRVVTARSLCAYPMHAVCVVFALLRSPIKALAHRGWVHRTVSVQCTAVLRTLPLGQVMCLCLHRPSQSHSIERSWFISHCRLVEVAMAAATTNLVWNRDLTAKSGFESLWISSTCRSLLLVCWRWRSIPVARLNRGCWSCKMLPEKRRQHLQSECSPPWTGGQASLNCGGLRPHLRACPGGGAYRVKQIACRPSFEGSKGL